MAEQTPSKPVTCRSWKRAAFKDCLKQTWNKVVGSKEVVGDFPVPMSPQRIATPAPYPEPATPPVRLARTPGGQYDHEATGSNHTSNHTSEYFDAKEPSQFEYLQQFQNSEFDGARLRNRKPYESEQGYEHAQQGFEHGPQFGISLGSDISQFGSEYPHFGTSHYQNGHLQQGFERPCPGLEEQLAGSFGNILLNTPTASQASPPHPWDDNPFLNPVASMSVHDHYDPPVNEHFYSGELDPGWLQQDDATVSRATSTAQQQQTTTPSGYGGMSVRTGETGDSRESMMDTAGTSTTSPYVLAPVAEEKSSILTRPFNKIYVELRRLTRGDEEAFASARMGRGLRVLGRAFCYTRRLRNMVLRRVQLAKSQRKRIRSPPVSPPQRPQNPCQQCTKKMRAGVDPTQLMTPGDSTQSSTERRYKGTTPRKGHGTWNVESRVSSCKANPKAKVWIGTFNSEREAALASDAGHYHCTEKRKPFNFPELVGQLGESQYQTVLALFNEGSESSERQAKKLVKDLALAHATRFGAP